MRVVALPCPRDQLAVFSEIDRHAHRTKGTIVLVVARIIADHVLLAQVFGDLRGDGGRFARVRGEEAPTAGIFSQSDQEVFCPLGWRSDRKSTALNYRHTV